MASWQACWCPRIRHLAGPAWMTGWKQTGTRSAKNMLQRSGDITNENQNLCTPGAAHPTFVMGDLSFGGAVDQCYHPGRAQVKRANYVFRLFRNICYVLCDWNSALVSPLS